MTWAREPGGLASWSTPIDSDIHGPQITAGLLERAPTAVTS